MVDSFAYTFKPSAVYPKANSTWYRRRAVNWGGSKLLPRLVQQNVRGSGGFRACESGGVWCKAACYNMSFVNPPYSVYVAVHTRCWKSCAAAPLKHRSEACLFVYRIYSWPIGLIRTADLVERTWMCKYCDELYSTAGSPRLSVNA